MTKEEYTSLINRLLERTREGKVKWEETSSNKSFLVYFKDFSLTVVHTFREYGASIVFELRNNFGQEIDSFSINDEEPFFKEAEELYTLAKRKAFNVEKAVKDILDELDSGKKVGEDT